MKKVMILGAGAGQIPFINICKKKGYYVIAVSTKGDYPGFKLADKCYYLDTRDKDAILQAAENEHIDAILTDQTDVSVPTVAYVAEKMGLRGIGYDTALIFSNKYLMREAAKESGVAVPKYDKAKTLQEAKNIARDIGYPIIIKPADSSGSRGVIKVSDEEELECNFEESLKYSSVDYIIVEQFISGIEYLADGFAMNSKYFNLDLGTKEFFDVPNAFVSSICKFFSPKLVTDDVGKKVLDANKKLVDYIGLNFGITHAEYIYSPSDCKVYLVEIAARGGGVYISSHLTPMASGINTNERIINYVVEGVCDVPDENDLLSKVTGYMRYAFPKGIITEISGVEETKKLEGVFMVSTDRVSVGKEVFPLENDNGSYGPILFVGNNDDECDKIIQKVKDTFKIKVKTENGIEDLIW